MALGNRPSSGDLMVRRLTRGSKHYVMLTVSVIVVILVCYRMIIENITVFDRLKYRLEEKCWFVQQP